MEVKYLALWQAWRHDQDVGARDVLAERYLWLVRYTAGRLKMGLPAHFEQDDLEGYGCFGLLEALQRYDPSRGIRFEAYALPWIRGACLKGIRALQWAPTLRKRVRELELAQEFLAGSLGRDPDRGELAAYLGLSLAALDARIAETGCLSVISMEELLYHGDDGEGGRLGDRLADTNGPDPQAIPQDAERRECLAHAIDGLSEQERMVVALIYYEGLMAREIASLLDLSEARISHLHSRALLRLRGKLARHKETMVS